MGGQKGPASQPANASAHTAPPPQQALEDAHRLCLADPQHSPLVYHTLPHPCIPVLQNLHELHTQQLRLSETHPICVTLLSAPPAGPSRPTASPGLEASQRCLQNIAARGKQFGHVTTSASHKVLRKVRSYCPNELFRAAQQGKDAAGEGWEQWWEKAVNKECKRGIIPNFLGLTSPRGSKRRATAYLQMRCPVTSPPARLLVPCVC